jgi:hypothetical protein
MKLYSRVPGSSPDSTEDCARSTILVSRRFQCYVSLDRETYQNPLRRILFATARALVYHADTVSGRALHALPPTRLTNWDSSDSRRMPRDRSRHGLTPPLGSSQRSDDWPARRRRRPMPARLRWVHPSGTTIDPIKIRSRGHVPLAQARLLFFYGSGQARSARPKLAEAKRRH